MKWICVLAGCIFSTTLQAQLKGFVQDSSQRLDGATVTVKGKANATTVTNADGAFDFRMLPDGSYELTVSYAGYKTYQQQLAVTNSKMLTVTLNPLKPVLQPVEVKATRAGDAAPFAKTNISRAEIVKNNLGQDIPFLLNQTPNVVVNSDAGNGVGYTGIRIRGSDASRVNMTINGIPYNDAESQGTFFVDLPDFLSSVSSIQLQRGVGTSSNGAGAFGATMNFSTHEYNEKAYAELNNSYGSFNTWKNTIRFGSGLIGKRFTIDARLSNITSDGYIDRATSSLQGGYFNAAYWGENSSLKFNMLLGKEKTYQAWYGVSQADLKDNRRVNYAGTEKPGEPYDNETDNYWQNHYQLFWTKNFRSNATFNTAFYLTTGRGYYEQYKADEALEDYGVSPFVTGNDTTYSTDLVRRLWLKNKLWGQILSLQINRGNNDITIGGGWSYYPANHFGEIIRTMAKPDFQHQWYDFDAKKGDANVYAKWLHKLSASWSLFTDLQYRYVRYQIEGFRNNPGISVDQQWNFLNPKAGISFQRRDWSGFFSYALGNKEPNRDDFEAGVAQLPRREQLHDFELNLTRKNLLKGLNLGATFYYMYYKDQLVLTGRINDVGAYARTNIPESYRAGVEIESAYNWANGSIKYNLSLSRNKIKDFTEYIDDYDNGGQKAINHGDPDIAFSPSIVQHASASYRVIRNGQLEWLSKYVGRQYLDNSGDKAKSLDPYFVNDLRAIYTIPLTKVLKEIKFIVQLNNIFDVMYEPNGYTFSYFYNNTLTTENYYFPMAGRNILAAVNISF